MLGEIFCAAQQLKMDFAQGYLGLEKMHILGKRGRLLIAGLALAGFLPLAEAKAQPPNMPPPPPPIQGNPFPNQAYVQAPSAPQPAYAQTNPVSMVNMQGPALQPPGNGIPDNSFPSAPVEAQAGTTGEVSSLTAPLSPSSIRLGEIGGKALTAGWDDGFFIKSEDRQFMLRITGQIQADYRDYPIKDDTQDIDNFFLRRARFGLEATMFNYYEFRFLPDFGQGKAVIQDSYLNVHYWDAFQFTAGKFKQPFSYEQLIQDRYVPTMERSLIDQLVPARDIGLMLHGEHLVKDQFDWAVSVSNGEINGDGDTNNQKDVNARLAYRPFASLAEPGAILHGLQVGFAVTTGVEDETLSPDPIKTPSGVRWLTFNSTVRADGVRNRYSPELAYFWRSLGFAAQYYSEDEKVIATALAKQRQDIDIEGGYVLFTWLLTGEERTGYSEQIVPRASFSPTRPICCPGAWELVLRASRLRFDNGIFTPGVGQLADPTKNSSGATELTTGFNWYFNAWVRMQFNYEHAWYDDPVQFSIGIAGLHKDSDALMTRFQIIF